METDKHSISQRRFGARIQTSLWVTMDRVCDRPRLVDGDISISGVYFDIDVSPGPVGSILKLWLATEDRESTLEVMGHLVRVTRCDDLYKGETVTGLAFGFLPRSATQRNDLEQFIRAVYTRHEDLQVNLGMAAMAGSPGAPLREAMVHILTLDGVALETDWAALAGQAMHVEVTSPTSHTVIGMDGQVVTCRRSVNQDGPPRFSIQVQFAGSEALLGDEEAVEASLDQAMGQMLEEAAIPSDDERLATAPRHMRGMLGQVGLASLLSFLEMERRSCHLMVGGPRSPVTLVVLDGNVIDVRSDNGDEPRDMLDELLDREQGDFEVVFQPVEGEDRLGVSTTTLLLDAARRRDEAGRL